jgi:hypothetical protein
MAHTAALTPVKEILTDVRDNKTASYKQSNDADQTNPRSQRWKGISQRLDLELNHWNQENQVRVSAHPSMFGKTNELALRNEIQRLKEVNARQAALIESLHQANIANRTELAKPQAQRSPQPIETKQPSVSRASQYIAQRQYQTQTPYSTFNRASTETALPETAAEKPLVQPTTTPTSGYRK